VLSKEVIGSRNRDSSKLLNEPRTACLNSWTQNGHFRKRIIEYSSISVGQQNAMFGSRGRLRVTNTTGALAVTWLGNDDSAGKSNRA
jgi:hypothetical protein